MSLLPSPYGLIAELVMVGAAVAGIGFIGARLEHNSMQVKLDAVQHAWDADRTKSAAAALDAQARYRTQESAWAKQLQEAQDASRKDREYLARIVAADRVERDSMRNQLTAYASGSRSAADDSVTACRSRAAILGQAVEDGLRVQSEMATAYGDLAIDYGTMFNGWPGSLSLEVSGRGLRVTPASGGPMR